MPVWSRWISSLISSKKFCCYFDGLRRTLSVSTSKNELIFVNQCASFSKSDSSSDSILTFFLPLCFSEVLEVGFMSTFGQKGETVPLGQRYVLFVSRLRFQFLTFHQTTFSSFAKILSVYGKLYFCSSQSILGFRYWISTIR